MRRLPVYFLLDCSDSMIGENHKKLNNGLSEIVTHLRRDPYALETVWISVIAFAGVAKTVVPLVELLSFYPPKLPLGSGTNLNLALNILEQEITKNTQKSTHEQKGDWKPLVFLLTDGHPTDTTTTDIANWKQKFTNKLNFVAIGLGRSADLATLGQLTDNVLLFNHNSNEDYAKFMQWISQSIAIHSQKIDDRNVTLQKNTIVDFIKEPKAEIYDDNVAILVGRCSKTKSPYLIKYEKSPMQKHLEQYNINMQYYNLTGCFHIEEDYFNWGSKNSSAVQINTSLLNGVPGCPYCGNQSAFAMCKCGKLMCVGDNMQLLCPWCKTHVTFNMSNGDSNFDISRGQG